MHSDTEYRPIVNRVAAQQSTDWLAANAQFSPNVDRKGVFWRTKGCKDMVLPALLEIIAKWNFN